MMCAQFDDTGMAQIQRASTAR